MSKVSEYQVVIDKLIHGGQGIGTLENGKKALVFGVLPGEKVIFGTTKKRSDFVEGVVKQVLEPSTDRIEPRDELYLSTSPWQIVSYDRENECKSQILAETMKRAGVKYERDILLHAPKEQWHYRNKMEYSFWGDDDGLHIALFNRGTHQKQIVEGSSIARPEIDEVATELCKILNEKKVRAGDLKSVILRCSQDGEVVAALFTRNEQFPRISELEQLCKGVILVYSNPKSPASVRTKDLYQFGDISLTDKILGSEISYDVFSFFQVNLDIFQQAMSQIDSVVGADKAIDMYSGVGTIGLSSISGVTHVIESDLANIEWARKNSRGKAEVVHAASEAALDYIDNEHTIIVDPPRAGLHKNLIDRIIEVKPPKLVYLSCNPSTQARDLKMLEEAYEIRSITGYNFFPRTPHIESLAVLVRNS